MFDLHDPGPNAAQEAAIDHGEGPLLILAGAGTGKTATLASRVGGLLRSGAAAERICLLTFSRRASVEMLTRAGRMVVDPSAARQVWGGTFHAVGHRLLRRYGGRLGLEAGFTVLDESDGRDLFGLVRHELGFSRGNGRRFPKSETLAKIYSRLVNAQRPLSSVVEESFSWCSTELDGIRGVFEAYLARKRAQNLLDFDDLLLCWRALGMGDGATFMASLFDHVLVDEYQDTNALQADIVEELRPNGRGLTVVGDHAQAIYSFRSATPRNILDFPNRFPGTTIIALEQNYRSTPEILALANAVMSQGAEGYPRTLWSARSELRRPLVRRTLDETAQATAVCDSVLAHREAGLRLRDQAVLFRAANHSDALEIELQRRNVPFVKYGGLRFLEAAHVKDLLAALRILENPYDELAWFRVLQLIEGIGPARASSLMATIGVRRPDGRLEAASPRPPQSPLVRFVNGEGLSHAAAEADASLLRAAIHDCLAVEPAGSTPEVEIDRLRQFLDPGIARRYDQPLARLADIDMLQRMAAGYASRARLLADLTLDPPNSTSDMAGAGAEDDDWLVLSTVHSAKGAEWPVVHIIHASDGLFPSDLATGRAETLEEERRLFYVAVTRARDVLEINATQRYYYQRNGAADTHGFGQLSRFLGGAVQTLVDHEHVGFPSPEAAAVEPPDRSEASASVANVDQLIESLLS